MSLHGESFLVGLIGSGIDASLTPPMHEKAADTHGIRYLYRPLNIDKLGPQELAFAPEDCGTLLKQGLALGYSAFNITHPCKQLIMDHLDEISTDAQRLGAVNTVVLSQGKTVGYNTDYSGFATALTTGLAPTQDDLSSVLQLGTGGAGSATAYALLSLGVETLYLFDIAYDRAQERAQELQKLFPQQTVLAASADNLPELMQTVRGLVNATPIGMHHHPGAPIDLALLRPDLWVADVIYLPQETELITAARALGARTLTGGHMAVGQAVDAFELITGIRPDATAMHQHFNQLTTN
ncbi:shikimate dehydrogenase [Rothia nasimurium]|uniref:shikimate dehydrogenase n=1 Tax=Rothia nasimurium TaxID=85336 RepID=UPI003BA0AB83